MAYKISFLIIPLVISSIAKIPSFSDFNHPNVVSKPLTFLPIDSSYITPLMEDYFNCDFYGPFSLSNPTNFQASFSYCLHSISSQSIIERVRFFTTSNSLVSAASKTSFYYTKGKDKTVAFNIPIVDCLTKNGLTLKFEIVNASTYSILKTFSATFYPRSESYIPGATLKRNVYTSKSLGFYGNGKELKEAYEIFDFTTFGDYLDVDYYYRLELNKISFRYPNDYSFVYDSAYLWFNDSDNLFPYLTHQSNKDVYIPISLYKSGPYIFFKYNKTFYINKRTLQISDVYRSGFVTTNSFYLPINGRSKFNNKTINFELDGMGLDGISTNISLRYDVSRSLVGICKDGDYCIIGGRR